MDNSGKFKITNSERIKRILERIADRHLNVLIRLPHDKKLGIRGRFDSFHCYGEKSLIRLVGISEIGYEKLKNEEVIKIEVMGMPTQVIFASHIVRASLDSVIISSPTSLVNIERRTNARYKTVSSRMAYIEFSDISKHADFEAAPPVYPYYENFTKWVSIADLSIGGASCMSAFPFLMQYYHAVKDAGPCSVKLITPMMDPIDIRLEFRWQKFIKTQVENAPEGLFSLRFLCGVQFCNLDNDTLKKIKFQLTQLSLADAV